MSIINKTMTRSLIVLAVAASFTVCAHENEHERYEAEAFSFALWGDMPYAKNGDTAPKIQALIDDINASKVAFTVFDGDIKDGSSFCDNWQYTDAIDRFNSFNKPMVYVPGDNEWTDCHRTNNGDYNALERLNYIRQTMFNSPDSFGQKKMQLEHQGELGKKYAENVRWVRGNVVFVSLNIPGSNNNKVNVGECISSKSLRIQADCDDDNTEYAARDAANIAFMQESFQFAKVSSTAGVMIVMQADPVFDLPETETYDERTSTSTGGAAPTLPTHDGYDAFLAALIHETNNFSGQVVLVHGDTHFYKVDKPLINQVNLVKNFTRVETFGSPNIHWIKVTVSPKNPNVFSFEPVIVPGN